MKWKAYTRLGPGVEHPSAAQKRLEPRRAAGDNCAMKQIGLLLAGVWLIAHGVIPLIDLHFKGLPLIMSCLAIAAGVMLILRR